MAARPTTQFEVNILGDGSATSFTIAIATGPIFLYSQSGHDVALSSGFSLASTLPIAAINVTSNGGLNVTSATILAGVLTLEFDGVLQSSSVYTVLGNFEF